VSAFQLTVYGIQLVVSGQCCIAFSFQLIAS